MPEEPLPNLTLIGPGGYAEAKYVCERLLDEAARKSGIPITVIRSGQIAGSSVDGYWAPTEYIPTIFKSSKILGKMPNKLPVGSLLYFPFLQNFMILTEGYTLAPC